MTREDAVERIARVRIQLDNRILALKHQRMTKKYRAELTAIFVEEQEALDYATAAITQNKLLWEALHDATKVITKVTSRHANAEELE